MSEEVKKTMKIEVLRDGVFVAEDVKAKAGEVHEIDAEDAKIIIKNKHACKA